MTFLNAKTAARKTLWARYLAVAATPGFNINARVVNRVLQAAMRPVTGVDNH
jgi:hypothetical protein